MNLFLLARESLHVLDCGLECQHETRHLADVHGRGSVLFFLPRFSFQLNAREFIDHVPKLSRVFFCRLEDAQQRQRKVYLERTHRAVRAEHRHWRALTHGSELLRNPHGYAGAKARAQISQNDFSRPARPPGWGDSGRVWRMRHKFSVASQTCSKLAEPVCVGGKAVVPPELLAPSCGVNGGHSRMYLDCSSPPVWAVQARPGILPRFIDEVQLRTTAGSIGWRRMRPKPTFFARSPAHRMPSRRS